MDYKLEITNREYDAVPLPDVKNFVKEDRNLNDDLLDSLRQSAEEMIFEETGVCTSKTDFKITLKEPKQIQIPFKPFDESSVSIKQGGSTLDPSKYEVSLNEIRFNGISDPDDIEVSFSCTAAAGSKYKTAVKVIVLMMFQRGIGGDDQTDIDPMNISVVKQILYPERTSYFH